MAGDIDIDVETGSPRIPMIYAQSLGSQLLFVHRFPLRWDPPDFAGGEFPSEMEMWIWYSCAIFITAESAGVVGV
jgi:hypothetical protein